MIGISGPHVATVGNPVTIQVTAGGAPTDFTYRWSRNGVVLSGQTNSTLSISSVNISDIGVYTCRPSNSRGYTNSSSTTLSVSGLLNFVSCVDSEILFSICNN